MGVCQSSRTSTIIAIGVLCSFCLMLLLLPMTAVRAEDSALEASQQGIGPVTGLPMPRFVSLKAAKANIRRGPNTSYKIDWIFVQQGMPLRVTAESGNWRKVSDIEGAGGWVHHALITGRRTVEITQDHLVHRYADAQSSAVAMFEKGVLARLQQCERDWCHVEAEGYDGWMPKQVLWGVTDKEIFD